MESTALRTKTQKPKRSADRVLREGCEPSDRFFRISKVVGSMEMLNSWVEWFKRRNIPCAITKGSGGYSLWRQGEEIGGESVTLSVLKKRKIVYSFGLSPAGEAGVSQC